MNKTYVIEIIKEKFQDSISPAKIPLQRDKTFLATLVDEGIEVDNLGEQNFLPWRVFEEATQLLVQNGGKAQRGDAMLSRLGDKGLPLNSIEGHIAYVVYERKIGDSVFRRISPIAAILVWAGICKYAPGELILN